MYTEKKFEVFLEIIKDRYEYGLMLIRFLIKNKLNLNIYYVRICG